MALVRSQWITLCGLKMIVFESSCVLGLVQLNQLLLLLMEHSSIDWYSSIISLLWTSKGLFQSVHYREVSTLERFSILLLEIISVVRAWRADYFHIKMLGVFNLLRVENAHRRMLIFQKQRVVIIPGVFTAWACFQPFLDRLKNPNTYFDNPKIALSNDV